MTSEEKPCRALSSPRKTGKLFKQELKSDSELTDGEIKHPSKFHNYEDDDDDEDSSDLEDDVETTLKLCKPSLFTKHPKRQWPWLIENHADDLEEEVEDKIETTNNTE